MRAVIYARYSSDNQRDASIEDQVRLCRAHIDKAGAELVATYTDHAISGATRMRPGYQRLLEDARSGLFDLVVAEALDRLSRDQEDVAGLYKHLTFSQVKLFTLGEGEVSELHVGLKGTMNALFLKDLALKTHRGLEGRVRAGKSAGGRAYGYKHVRQFNEEGEAIPGLRKVDPLEAAVVRRIFKMFAGGSAPRSIAMTLNAEGVFGPDGRPWCDTTIRGHSTRKTGLLRNELYRGEIVWNKQRYIKDPRTGNRLARINPQNEWIRQSAPELRILDEDLWNKVQQRLDGISGSSRVKKAKATKFWENRRPKHLLTGLALCRDCGGPLSAIGKDYLACSSARRTGLCENRTAIRRSVLESAVLDLLRNDLLQPHLVAEFVSAYQAEIVQQSDNANSHRATAERQTEKVEKQIEAIIDTIASGFRSESIRQRLEDLEATKQRLEISLRRPRPEPIRIPPNLPEIYTAKVARLEASLADPAIRDEAADLLRGLIDAVHVTTIEDGWEVEIKGEISRMANLAGVKTEQNQCSVKVVAGAGFEPTTFRL